MSLRFSPRWKGFARAEKVPDELQKGTSRGYLGAGRVRGVRDEMVPLC
jgi:hypothetical protein